MTFRLACGASLLGRERLRTPTAFKAKKSTNLENSQQTGVAPATPLPMCAKAGRNAGADEHSALVALAQRARIAETSGVELDLETAVPFGFATGNVSAVA